MKLQNSDSNHTKGAKVRVDEDAHDKETQVYTKNYQNQKGKEWSTTVRKDYSNSTCLV
jgi:hypothetical protein